MEFHHKFSRLILTCGVAVSVQLLVLSLEPLTLGDFIRTANADGEDGRPELSNSGKPNLALADYRARECEAAKRRAHEISPELLALAKYDGTASLYEHVVPAECLKTQHAAVIAIDDALPEAIEIVATPPVVSVVAAVSGEDPPVANKSSIRLSSADRYTHPLGKQLAAVDMDSLDKIRGGFELEQSGLKFSIGIERAVFINGNLVATTVLVPKDLQLTSGGGSAASVLPTVSTGALAIVQNGTGNNVNAQISPNLAGTVIQNTLNDQKIQNVTTINATVNSMQMLRATSLHNAIQTGIVGSLRR